MICGTAGGSRGAGREQAVQRGALPWDKPVFLQCCPARRGGIPAVAPAGTEAILQRLALRGVHALYLLLLLLLVPPPLFACISFLPGPPAPFLLSFVFLLRRELFDAACSLFSSVRVRTRLTH